MVNVGKYTSPMDPLGIDTSNIVPVTKNQIIWQIVRFQALGILAHRTWEW